MKIKKIVLLGLLIAMQIVLSEYLAIKLPFMKISLTIIPITAMAMIFGPVTTALGLVIADILGLILFPVISPHYGFIISNALTGFIYGYFLFNKRNSTKTKLIINIIISSFIVNFGVNTLLNTYWLTDILGESFLVLLKPRAFKNLISIAVNITLVATIYPFLFNIYNSFLGGNIYE